MVFREFSNEERCNAAKSKLEGSLKEAGTKLRSGLEDLKSLGTADPARDHYCLQRGGASRNKGPRDWFVVRVELNKETTGGPQ